MNILIATDAWEPQVNGVVRTLQETIRELRELGHKVKVIEPSQFNTFKCPFTHDVRLPFWVSHTHIGNAIYELLRQERNPIEWPKIHIATEGPIGYSVKKYCELIDLPYTTAYHTKYPELLNKFIGIPKFLTRSYMRWFHRGKNVMVPTEGMKASLEEMGLKRVKVWNRGISDLFHPRLKKLTGIMPGRDILYDINCKNPVGLYVGRLSKEKNIDAFCSLSPSLIIKVIVGDGPDRDRLERKYPDVHFLGMLHGEDLAQAYCNADVFVFPSKTDTLGLVVLEALASGIPVACYPGEGPAEIIQDGGVSHENLEFAVEQALRISHQVCLRVASQHSWKECTKQFLENL